MKPFLEAIHRKNCVGLKTAQVSYIVDQHE